MFNSISSVDKIFETNDSVDIDELLLESVKSLVQLKDFYKAYGLSKLIQEGYESAESTIIIAENMKELKDSKDAVILLNNASIELFKEPQEWKQAELLCRIAVNFHRLGLQDTAKEFFNNSIEVSRKGESSESSQISVDSSSVLIDVVKSIAITGEKEWAVEIANKIKNPRKKELALEAIESI